VEAIYGTEMPWPVPDAIVSAAMKAEGEAHAARSIASYATLKLEDGYSRRGPWDDDARVLTRLGEDTTTLRLARIVDGRVVPWCQGADADVPARDWALSEITVRRARVTGVPDPTGWLAEAVAATKTTWSRYDRNMPVLVLEGTRVRATGVVVGRKGQSITPRAHAGTTADAPPSLARVELAHEIGLRVLFALWTLWLIAMLVSLYSSVAQAY
jgi:hypothetical protein